ncbi:hypothetical protein BO221_17150 [Archangium sp. Cb G35]|nr:hypothetical protein BO221_17150 [Archangium sp. Cb G35]
MSGPLLSLLVLVSACAPVEEQPPRVGTFPWPGSGPFFLSSQGGLDREEPMRPERLLDVRSLEVLEEVR